MLKMFKVTTMKLHKTQDFRLIAASFTPFLPDGHLNLDLVPGIARHLQQSGLSGVFVNGTTGEYASLTMEERCAITEIWVDAGHAHDLQVVVHVGDNSLPNTLKLAKHAASCGADAISALPPSYFKPADLDALVRYTTTVANHVPDCPFYYYHIPCMTGVHFAMSDYLEKAAPLMPSLRGIKYSDLEPMDVLRCGDVSPGSHEILFGCDQALLTGLGLGVAGAVGSTYNFAAPLYLRIAEAFQRGDMPAARALQTQSVRLVDRLDHSGFLPSAKLMMRLFDLDCGPVRSPLTPLCKESAESLLEEIQAFPAMQAIMA